MKEKKSPITIDLDALSGDALESIKEGITGDLKTHIKFQIASNFPERLRVVIEKFYTEEIEPELMKFLRRHKAEILKTTKGDLLSLAIAGIKKNVATVIEEIVDRALRGNDDEDY